VALHVFFCFAFAYLLSYLLRTGNAVMAPFLRADLGLSDSDLGLLSSAYYFAFACMQLPLGIWLDKYGPRRLVACLMLVAAAGSAVFAMSETLFGLWIGRALIGMGVSACLMAAFKGFRLWYPAAMQSRLAALMSVAGAVGALLATIPINFLIGQLGWRGVFWVISALVLLAALLVWIVLKAPEAANPPPEKPVQAQAARSTSSDGGYRQILRHPYFRRMILLALIPLGIYPALQTLWAAPWLITVVGLSIDQTANVLFMFNFCLMAVHLGLSWIGPKLKMRSDQKGWTVHRVVWMGLAFGIAMQALSVVFTQSWAWIFWVLLSGCLAISILIQVNIGMSFPASHVGRANSAFNFLIFTGSFMMQWGIGLMSDGFQAWGLSPADGLRAALASCVVLQLIVLALYLHSKAEPGIRE